MAIEEMGDMQAARATVRAVLEQARKELNFANKRAEKTWHACEGYAICFKAEIDGGSPSHNEAYTRLCKNWTVARADLQAAQDAYSEAMADWRDCK